MDLTSESTTDWLVSGFAHPPASVRTVRYRPTSAGASAEMRAAPTVEQHAKVSAYWSRIQADPAVQRVLSEMRTAIVKSPMRNLLPH